jgi:hypothetical protein
MLSNVIFWVVGELEFGVCRIIVFDARQLLRSKL